ncbi:hypothetical protein Clacol_009148 [Clathrus columnatus]|uniref:Uncharacterized protein n=1 Tax=Clathrus columnatus TaxID=1419009 RepID=A0AAV5AJR4_9AGAM|nr:hypothetical protein Clacol_009148 [Clathrus columnatus]
MNINTGGHKSRLIPSGVRNAIVDGSVQILRRSSSHINLHPRLHSPSQTSEPSNSRTLVTQPNDSSKLIETREPENESLVEIRACLLPPPIPGVNDWGIPPPTDEICDTSLRMKLDQFFELKRGNPPKHFNDSLMSNRSFCNPHLYAKLVEFVDVDERCSNISKETDDKSLVCKGSWDLDDLDGWDADKIGQYYGTARDLCLSITLSPATAQKERFEEQSASQAPGKRNRIGFTSESTRHGQSQKPVGSSRKDRREGNKYNPYITTTEGSKLRSSTRWQ